MASMSSSTPPKQSMAALVLPDDCVSLHSRLPDELSIRRSSMTRLDVLDSAAER
jgi:hypothetical protein